MKYIVIIERTRKSVGAYVPDLPGCAVVAETRDEAVKLIREAIPLHLEALREGRGAIPEPASATRYVRV